MKQNILIVTFCMLAIVPLAALNTLKEKVHSTSSVPHHQPLVLAADIGGTNSDFGLLTQENDKLILLRSYHLPTKKIESMVSLVCDLLLLCKQQYNRLPTQTCFACAGVSALTRDYSELTNNNVTVDAQKIVDQTELESCLVINDFEAIGYGIQHLKSDDLLVVCAPRSPLGTTARLLATEQHIPPTKVVIGAGTGFGFSTLLWNTQLGRYIPLPSEGGHADLPVQTQEEFDLCKFLKSINGSPSVEWEDVLTGYGVSKIYKFLMSCDGLEKTDAHRVIEQDNFSPYSIVKFRNTDPRCIKTFELFTTFYGRCAKKAALDALALGGVYIAGGIAAKFLDLFDREVFFEQFFETYKLRNVIAHIPVYVIKNYNVSLYGAASYALLHDTQRKKSFW